MARKLETYTGFDPIKAAQYFEAHDWEVSALSVAKVNLAKVSKGAALECGDGRFDSCPDREMWGPRIFGGVNAFMALHTGGDDLGMDRATELLKRFGVTPGTHSAEHGGCGYFDLWKAGQLEHAVYPYEAPDEDEVKGMKKLGRWLEWKLKTKGGKHFRLNGEHQEKAVRLNPFRGYTETSGDGERFKVDDWLLADFGIPDSKRFHKIRETVEKLKPDAQNLEILIP